MFAKTEFCVRAIGLTKRNAGAWALVVQGERLVREQLGAQLAGAVDANQTYAFAR